MITKHRRRIRLKDYDYSSNGFYFVTVCIQDRMHLFGKVVGADPRVGPEIELNQAGRMIQSWWMKLPDQFPHIKLDFFVIMPNHIHGIIAIQRRTHGSAPTLGRIVQWFKTMTTNYYIRGVKQNQWPPFSGKLWQRNYYEHVIRNEKELLETQRYIEENPLKWDKDPENV